LYTKVLIVFLVEALLGFVEGHVKESACKGKEVKQQRENLKTRRERETKNAEINKDGYETGVRP